MTTTRVILVALAALFAAGTASAQTSGEVGLYPSSRYYDADAGAVLSHEGNDTGAIVDGDLSHSDPSEVAGGDFWTWMELSFAAILEALAEAVGLDAPDAVDGEVEVFASDDGVDLDAKVEHIDFDESPVGHLDGETWKLVDTVESKLP